MTRPTLSLVITDLPTEARRSEAYNEELVRRYLTGQYLTKADISEARALIAAQKDAGR